ILTRPRATGKLPSLSATSDPVAAWGQYYELIERLFIAINDNDADKLIACYPSIESDMWKDVVAYAGSQYFNRFTRLGNLSIANVTSVGIVLSLTKDVHDVEEIRLRLNDII